MRQNTVNFFGHKRHKRMKQTDDRRRQTISVDCVARLTDASSLFKPALLNSIYQLQKSSQIKPYNSLPTNANSYLSMLDVTEVTVSFKRLRIHVSVIDRWLKSTCSNVKSSGMFIMTKREAFQILLMKFQEAFQFFFQCSAYPDLDVELVVMEEAQAVDTGAFQ